MVYTGLELDVLNSTVDNTTMAAFQEGMTLALCADSIGPVSSEESSEKAAGTPLVSRFVAAISAPRLAIVSPDSRAGRNFVAIAVSRKLFEYGLAEQIDVLGFHVAVPSTSPSPSPPSESKDSPDTTGRDAGIGVGVVAAASIAAVGVVLYGRRKNDQFHKKGKLERIQPSATALDDDDGTIAPAEFAPIEGRPRSMGEGFETSIVANPMFFQNRKEMQETIARLENQMTTASGSAKYETNNPYDPQVTHIESPSYTAAPGDSTEMGAIGNQHMSTMELNTEAPPPLPAAPSELDAEAIAATLGSLTSNTSLTDSATSLDFAGGAIAKDLLQSIDETNDAVRVSSNDENTEVGVTANPLFLRSQQSMQEVISARQDELRNRSSMTSEDTPPLRRGGSKVDPSDAPSSPRRLTEDISRARSNISSISSGTSDGGPDVAFGPSSPRPRKNSAFM